MFSSALARRPAGSGRGGPVPFRQLWPVLLEELARAHRARAGAEAVAFRASALVAASREVAGAAPSRQGAAGGVAP